MVNSESDVIGEYELTNGTGKIVLSISADKSFSETIYMPNGQIKRCSGKWLWKNGISFDQLWIPQAFAPDYILEADALAKTDGQPKYTEPGHWSMSPEKHWGRVVIPIFDDENFEMVRHRS